MKRNQVQKSGFQRSFQKLMYIYCCLHRFYGGTGNLRTQVTINNDNSNGISGSVTGGLVNILVIWGVINIHH